MIPTMEKHAGPAHPGTGTDQSVHGSGRSGLRGLGARMRADGYTGDHDARENLRERLGYTDIDVGGGSKVRVYRRPMPSDDEPRREKPQGPSENMRVRDRVDAHGVLHVPDLPARRRTFREALGLSKHGGGSHDDSSHGNWARNTSAPKLKEKIKEGGVTVDIRSGDMPSTGYAVALRKGTETKRPLGAVTEGWIRKFIADHKDEIDDPENYFGGWVEEVDGEPYAFLDVSEVFSDRAEAEKAGREREQIGIFDFEAFETIYL